VLEVPAVHHYGLIPLAVVISTLGLLYKESA